MGWKCALWAACVLACSGGRGAATGPDAGIAAAAAVVAVAPEGPGEAAAAAPAPPPPPYAEDVVSLRLKRSIVVRFAPDENAKAIGTIAQDTRVGWRRVAEGPGCGRWVEIEPRGWVCDRYLEPSRKPPGGVELPKLKPGEIVPGVFGKVVNPKGAAAYRTADDVRKKKPSRVLAGSVKVRKVDDVVVDGKLYWKTTNDELVLASDIRVLEPSTFQGVWVGQDGAPGLPLAWARSRKAPGSKVPVRSAPNGPLVKHLAPRTVVSILEESADRKAMRIGPGQWVLATDLHVAWPTEPPPATEPDERWFDVDLDEQVVVAYEGTRPVYATMMSSGSKKWPTAPGVYRIWIKFAETDMNGQMGDEAPYSVATVPWTMFFAKDLAFHTAYWHDAFGEPRSHGCLNLSPRDARTLYFWASPDVPPGWSMAHGIVERPGSLVRIRSRAVPEPEFMGYARRVYEARKAREQGTVSGN